jgi:putative membrane protein
MAGEERTELAGTRTDLAEDRTLLANERTFAGWVRTSLGAVGIGLGFNALFERLEPVWLPKAISTAFLLIAIFVILVAEQRAGAVKSRLDSHQVKTFKLVNLRLITGSIVVATLALIVSIWLLV